MRILAFAYACEPGSGSEPGAGWAWARMLRRLGDVTVITRENNRAVIEAGLRELPDAERFDVVYTDLPAWARFWKKGRRGVQPYYVLWQLAALRLARRLNDRTPFDLVWHLTFANAWLGSTAALVGPPFVYGPVGGGVDVPWVLRGELGRRGIVFEVVRLGARAGGRYLNPLARIAWRRAAVILVQNPETARWFPTRHRSKTEVFPNVVLERSVLVGRERRNGDLDAGRIALFAGRLVPWKGVALAIRAVAHLSGWTLVVCGEGSDEARLEALATKIGIADRVRFLGTVPRSTLRSMMRTQADLFLYPSMREEAGWAVAEAIDSGLPVVALDRGGPPVLGAHGVPVGPRDEVVRALADAVPETAHPGAAGRFTMEARLAALSAVLADRDLLATWSAVRGGTRGG